MVDDPIGEDDVVRVPVIGIPGGILPDSGIGTRSEAGNVRKIEPEAVGTVGSGIVFRFPRTSGAVGLSKFGRGKGLSVNEMNVGKIAREISVRPVENCTDVLWSGGINECEIGILRRKSSRKRNLPSIYERLDPIERRGIGRIYGNEEMIPCRRIPIKSRGNQG